MTLQSFPSLPDEYQQVLLLVQQENNIEVFPLEELKGGWTGARLFLVSVSANDARTVDHLVLKLDRIHPKVSTTESEKHKLVRSLAPKKFAMALAIARVIKCELVSRAPTGLPIMMAYSPYTGFAPASTAEAIASGMSAMAVVSPATKLGISSLRWGEFLSIWCLVKPCEGSKPSQGLIQHKKIQMVESKICYSIFRPSKDWPSCVLRDGKGEGKSSSMRC